jgi:hypothetical protein
MNKCYSLTLRRIVMKHVEWEDDEYTVCVNVTHAKKNSDETCWMRRYDDEYIVCVKLHTLKRIVMKHVKWEADE